MSDHEKFVQAFIHELREMLRNLPNGNTRDAVRAVAVAAEQAARKTSSSDWVWDQPRG